MHPTPLAIVKASRLTTRCCARGFVGAACAFCLWLGCWRPTAFIFSNPLPSCGICAAGAAGVLFLVPVCRFLKSPAWLFLSALIAWTMLTLAYGAMGPIPGA